MAAETFAGVALVFGWFCATTFRAKTAIRIEVIAKSGIRIVATLSGASRVEQLSSTVWEYFEVPERLRTAVLQSEAAYPTQCLTFSSDTGEIMPRSVTIAVISSAGVTSKAGL